VTPEAEAVRDSATAWSTCAIRASPQSRTPGAAHKKIGSSIKPSHTAREKEYMFSSQLEMILALLIILQSSAVAILWYWQSQRQRKLMKLLATVHGEVKFVLYRPEVASFLIGQVAELDRLTGLRWQLLMQQESAQLELPLEDAHASKPQVPSAATLSAMRKHQYSDTSIVTGGHEYFGVRDKNRFDL
jgi:hypothetical protein